MIAERSHYLFSHTQCLWLESDLRKHWFGQGENRHGLIHMPLAYALDVSCRYVQRANQYPLLGGCNVTVHNRNPQGVKEAPSGFHF